MNENANPTIALSQPVKSETFLAMATPGQTKNSPDRRVHELILWLRALRSFFDIQHHPLSEVERANITHRVFTSEAHIVREVLLHCSQLILTIAHHDERATAGAGEISALTVSSLQTEKISEIVTDHQALTVLAELMTDSYVLCVSLLKAPSVGLDAWSSFGKCFLRQLEGAKVFKKLMQADQLDGSSGVPSSLLALAERITPETLGADIRLVFQELARLLAHLRFIEHLLSKDLPLKQAVPIFTLVHEETRALLNMVETRVVRIEGLEESVFDALDGTAYAIGMELRKAFEYELVGVSALRQAPLVYAKIENAHGLLRDCFQQSTVALAQIFDPTHDCSQLFAAFQTKLEQSLALRHDLWTLLQLVQQAERDQERTRLARLVEQLMTFKEGSLRFLMYKDWESYEHFVEEVATARGAGESSTVLNRFGTYLETLFGQINMRAVLNEHPFDYSASEN